VLRSKFDGPGEDRWLTPEIEFAVELVKSGKILQEVEKVIGELA
jgi:histidine ammonia-lyase